jgi:hypothetical protein
MIFPNPEKIINVPKQTVFLRVTAKKCSNFYSNLKIKQQTSPLNTRHTEDYSIVSFANI